MITDEELQEPIDEADHDGEGEDNEEELLMAAGRSSMTSS